MKSFNSLGFDASAALDALAKMDQALSGFDAQLSSRGRAMSVWNEQGRETVQVLKDIASGATSAAAAMSKLQSAFCAQQQPTGRPPARGGRPVAQPPAVTPPKVTKITPQIDKLRSKRPTGRRPSSSCPGRR